MQERRLAAIMFTDIVGYTALMNEDEKQTLQIVEQNKQIHLNYFRKYNGTLIKEMGDGLMASFDSSAEAIRSAIDIQKQIREKESFQVRIGIHQGDILFKDDDIFGDGVNIASRIEALADPGGIYISETVKNSLDKDEEIELKHLGKAKLKNVRKPVVIYAIQVGSLPEPSMKRFHKLANPKKKLAILPTVITFFILVILALIVVKYLDNRTKIIKAKATLDQIEDLVNVNWRDYSEAYYLAKEVEKIIPKDPRLMDYIEKTSVKMNINTDPPGGNVYYKLYNKPEDDWQSLGITPLDSVQVPISAIRLKIEKEGHETVLAAALSFTIKNLSRLRKFEMYTGQNFHRVLDKKGAIPADMTRVLGNDKPYGRINDFLIDKFEVSNRDYKTFITEGGYQNEAYWKELDLYLRDTIEWAEAIDFFVDKSGQTGPSTWENQNYPEGEDNFPVTGISWFEANAYAHYKGKVLPSKDHWGLARGDNTMMIVPHVGGNANFAPFSNFNVKGPVEVGSLKGLTSFGTFDMAGNVREWCWNESSIGRCVRGGSWNDNPYMFYDASQASPFDRSDKNGFRCVLYLDSDSIPEAVFSKVEEYHNPNFFIEGPNTFTEDQFERYKASYYEYDNFELQDTVISRTENKKGWNLEKVEFNTAYDNERMTAYVFLPTNTKPPYQSVIYGQSSNAFYQENSDDIENYFEFRAFLEFIVQNGRAVVFPIIKGTFGQRPDLPVNPPPGSHQKTTHLTRKIKDYRRCLDYLETRNDFILEKIAFYGMSMGPRFGTFLSAVDSRIKTNIFYAGGLSVDRETKPEVNMAYFLPQVKIPTLMINGKYDVIFRPDNITTMFNLLGTPEKNKKLALFNSDHLAPVEDLKNETLAWLDQQFGKVEYIVEIQRL